MALASGTRDPMKQKALLDAAEAQKKAKTTTPTPKTSPFGGGNAAAIRGLSTPTQQTGNVAKSNLATYTQMKEDVMKQAQNAQTQEERDYLAGQLGKIDSAYKSGGANAFEKLQNVKSEAFYSPQGRSGYEAQYDESGKYIGATQQDPSNRLSYTGNERRTPQSAIPKATVSKADQGKYTIITDSTGKQKKVPVNLQFQKYLAEKEPWILGEENKIRRLNTLRGVIQAGGTISDDVMKELQALGVDADENSIVNKVSSIMRNVDDYKMKNNVSGKYLDWQGAQGTDVAQNKAMETQAKGTIAPTEETPTTPTGASAEGTTTEVGGEIAGGIETRQNTGVSENLTGGSTMSGADSIYNNTVSGAGSVASAGMEGAQNIFSIQENARRNQFLLAASGSNLAEKAASQGLDYSSMSAQQLEDFMSQNGIDLSDENKASIRAGGDSAIKTLKEAQNINLAQINLEKAALEREKGRALNDREEFNAQQDARMRKMMGMNNQTSNSSNVSYMNVLEKGQRAMEDLVSSYADKGTYLGLQAMDVVNQYSSKIAQIESETASIQEQAKAALVGKISTLIDAGMLNKLDLEKTITKEKQDYITTINKAASERYDRVIKEQQQLFENTMKIKEFQQKEDTSLMSVYGTVFRNGQEVLGQDGMPIPTMDGMTFIREGDKIRSEAEGIVYQNGKPLLDSNGNTVPTFSASKFYMQEQRARDEFGMNYNLNVAKFNQDVQEFGANYAIKQAEEMRNADLFNMGLLEKGYELGAIDPQTRMVVDSTGIYNKGGSKYTPIVQGDAIRFKVPQDVDGGLKAWSSLREQCGEFVNDVIGKRGFMSDLFSDKMKKVTSILPIIGSAFVQSTNNQYGHTGMVEKVNTNEYGVATSMEIVDSNAKGNGKIERATIDISYGQDGTPKYTRNGKTVAIKGFTDSVLGSPTKQFTQLSDGRVISKIAEEGKQEKGKTLPAGQLTMLADAKLFPEMLNNLEKQITEGEATYDPIMGTLRSWNPYDVSQKKAEAELARNAQLIGKFMEGGVLRKEDEAKYRKMLPNSSDVKEVALEKLRGVRDMLNQKQREYLSTWQEGGYDVSNVSMPNASNEASMEDIQNLLNNL